MRPLWRLLYSLYHLSIHSLLEFSCSLGLELERFFFKTPPVLLISDCTFDFACMELGYFLACFLSGLEHFDKSIDVSLNLE